MGRHSAPDDADESADLAEPGVDPDGAGIAVAERESGRHSRDGDPAATAPSPDGADDAPPEPEQPEPEQPEPEHGDGLSVLHDAFDAGAPDEPQQADEQGPEESSAQQVPRHDAPTTEIRLADIARHDRALPEETTAKIAPVTGGADRPRPQPSESVTDDPAVPSPGSDAGREGKPARTGGHATRHDLALIKRHGDVRARAIAAIVVPFAVYVVVLAVMGNLTVHHLIWVWIPAIVAGVLVGFVLDAGHRRYPHPTGDAGVTTSEGPA
ncbi:hypothetical protein [uncultured Jatrophihabitans sp.]|uniref:hypothetical protein n=1 Tax=uncultured Jatrophihabitans sp. TaxID=1610747 RepID=UPI0035CC993B